MTALNMGATLVIILLLICIANVIVIGNRREQTLHQLQSYADNQITNRMNKHIFFTSIWESMIIQDGGEVVNFKETTERIVHDYGREEINGVILAPQGKVEYTYGDDQRMAMGADLLTEEFSKTNAIRAKYTGLTTLSVFYKEKDGSYSLYIYNPIYLHDHNEDGSDSKKQSFWGFSILALKVPDLFNGIGFVGLGNRIDFQLSGAVDGTKGETVYLESSDQRLNLPVNYYFSVPNGTWHFAASWSGGWITPSEQIIEALVVLIALILAFIFTFLNRREAELMDISRSDPLTGVNNRRALRSAFRKIAREDGELSAIFIDIDDFKIVNDEHGHEKGDEVLKTLSSRLIEAFGADHCYRYGGDEFLVVASGLTMDDIDRQLDIVHKPILLRKDDGTEHVVSISGGHARGAVNDAEDLRELIRRADVKLYEAKTEGKNHIRE